MNDKANFNFLYDEYAKGSRLLLLKDHFQTHLDKAREEEQKYCQEMKKQGHIANLVMADDNYTKIIKILDSCRDFYELESLNRCIFRYNIIPDNYGQIKQFAEALREVL